VTRQLNRVADVMLGSWKRTLLAAAVIVVVVVGAVAGLATFGDLRHASLPGHPYPPAGYERNPFSPNPDDLMRVADAKRVKASFQEDGSIELDAFARGDASMLGRADRGGRLSTLQGLIEQNNAAGIVQRYGNRVEQLLVGRLPAPGTTTVMWCVEERGTATLTDVRRASGQIERTQRYRFEGRFWLASAGDRYVVTDAAITNTPLAGG
jgi:hypothetical protein